MFTFCQWCLIKSFLLSLITASILFSTTAQDEQSIKLRDIAPKDYDYLQPPREPGGPTSVSIDISKLTIRTIDESDMSFSVSLELWQIWNDFRLKFPPWIHTKYQVLDSTWINKIWNPKLHFVNAFDGKLDNIITPSSFFWISDESIIYYCCRVILSLTCDMDLKDFPHDEQECAIQMGSSVYTNKNITMRWRTDVNRTIQLSELQQYKIVGLRKSTSVKPLGAYKASCVQMSIYLRRRTGYYMINVYIPTILIVIMSMLTFWIPPDAVPARITLGVTSLLTIITKQYQASMPNVSYVVALNVWLSCCIAFVFFSLLEFALVIALSNRKRSERAMSPTPDLILPLVVLRSNGTWSIKNKWTQKAETEKIPQRIDIFSRIFFPVSFVAFCITYYQIYTV